MTKSRLPDLSSTSHGTEPFASTAAGSTRRGTMPMARGRGCPGAAAVQLLGDERDDEQHDDRHGEGVEDRSRRVRKMVRRVPSVFADPAIRLVEQVRGAKTAAAITAPTNAPPRGRGERR